MPSGRSESKINPPTLPLRNPKNQRSTATERTAKIRRESNTLAVTNSTPLRPNIKSSTNTTTKMPRTPEAQSFFHAVYSAVQQIPPGKVTTYGHIAKLIGTPQRPRQVGVCLKHLPPSPSSNSGGEEGEGTGYASRFNHDTVPWQRVINAKGVISPRSQPSGSRNQAAALELEGVTVTTGALGELMVDFGEYGWFPSSLPSDIDGEDFDDEFDSQGEEDV
ncbi:hypothetical protein QBC44DRAFT_324639 [Cladorrhinum sp. PSN332]|nr:hypothetical protein QBC44DRAFT_324639 [Cladorrhinum sp. PSN332]